MKPRYVTIPLFLLTLGLLVFVQSASNRITSPERARLHDRHHAILAEPANHGMKIQSLKAPDGTPYLLCEGLNVTGESGRILREQLQARNASLAIEPATLLLLHGHGSRKEHHLAIAERFCAAGFTCVLPDLPGHGEHSDRKATFGKKEVPRLLNLIKDLRLRHDLPERWGVFGLSQGGAIALQLVAADNSQFTSVATVSTFAHLSHTIKSTAERKSPALAALVPMVQLDLKFRHGLPVQEISPARAASRISLPVFVAHGKEDTFIPPANAETIFNNLTHPEKRLRIIPDAGHGNVLAKGDFIYADLCQFFLKASQ